MIDRGIWMSFTQKEDEKEQVAISNILLANTLNFPFKVKNIVSLI